MKRLTLTLTFGSFLLIVTSMVLGVHQAGAGMGMGAGATAGAVWETGGGNVAAGTAMADEIDIPPTTHALMTKLLQKVGIDNPNGEITSDSIFHTSNRNFYLYLYQQMFGKPEKEAIIELGAAYSLTPTDAQAVIDGSYTPLLRGRGPSYTQDRAIGDMRKIQQSYIQILRQKQLGYQLNANVTATEIFANGSLDDSSFDLIHDLDIIEKLLFVDQSAVTMNQHPFQDPTKKDNGLGKSSGPSTGTGAAPGGASAGTGMGGNGGDKPPSGGGKGNGGGDVPPAGGMKKAPPNNDVIADPLKVLENATAFADKCPKDAPLNKALEKYDEANGTANQNGDGGGGKNGGSSAKSGGSGSPTLSPTQLPLAIENVIPPEFLPITTSPAAPATIKEENLCDDLAPKLDDPNEPSNQKPPIKTDYKSEVIYTYPPDPNAKHIFCVSLDVRIRSYESIYPPGMSCIQCTIKAMDATMKALLSQSLSANKLTGNAYESSKCATNLSSSLDINLFLIPVPIITPQKFGPLVGHDIGTEWDRFVKKNLPFNSQKDDSPQRVATTANQNLGENATQEQLLSAINSAIQLEISKANQNMANRTVSSQTDSKSEGYQQVIQEMRLMTTYFASFQNILSHFNNGDGSPGAKGSCQTLLDKKDINE